MQKHNTLLKMQSSGSQALKGILLGLLLVMPLATYAAVEDDVAALDVRVTANEGDIIALQNLVAVKDENAATVQLRISCVEGGVPVNNCYEVTEMRALFDWITNVRKPNAAAPLTVKIGEGQFLTDQVPIKQRINGIVLYCDAATGFEGYITFQGAGRTATSFGHNNNYTLVVDACEGLVFKDLTLKGYGNSGGLVLWTGGGSSVWENVDTDSQFSTWSSRAGSCGATRGKHYWFGSRIANHDVFNVAVGYQEECDESWFFGTEIQNTATSGSVAPTVFAIANAGEVHVYGGVIRSNAPGQLSSGRSVKAVNVSGGGNIHIHGTGIDVISDAANDIIAIDVGQDGTVHAQETAYNLKTAPGGTITRVVNAGGMAMASYAWQSAAEAPAITSITGADTAIVTNTADGHPHQLVYDTSCGTSKWYDTTIGACR